MPPGDGCDIFSRDPPLMDTREKIPSREGLEEVLEEHRGRGCQIVLADGVFDLLRRGRIRYLRAARAKGDILAVAVLAFLSEDLTIGSLLTQVRLDVYAQPSGQVSAEGAVVARFGVRLAVADEPEEPSTDDPLRTIRRRQV